MDRRAILESGVILATGLFLPFRAFGRERVIGGPCEGCEWVFEGLPRNLASTARIAPANEPGAPLVIEGEVTSPDGKPAAQVIVYAYHTDHSGIYPPARNRHGRLRGWAATDARGRYRFETIRPGAYPGREVAAHVHMHVIEPGVGTYYIDNLEFLDDPLQSGRPGAGRGGPGLVLPLRRDGVWQAQRDIVLGRHIQDHPQA
ncbi:MAG TPA: hypothetical protein VF033_12115 [Steroidobacteraceae bacterium]|jgi:protocatechuate 3,4-dioxygenase beta subunit